MFNKKDKTAAYYRITKNTLLVPWNNDLVEYEKLYETNMKVLLLFHMYYTTFE